MKAWRVDCGDGWCCLVMAPTRSKAKALFRNNGPAFPHDYEYIDIRALRRTDLDGLTDCEKIFESPDDLPEGVEFWSEE